ncbi:MAG: energy-coupling factor transporter ATPase [Lachnospiraceae bacterium]|nr:energy-coupling factor transporter ATPase [Lachnospiraceae bacterium]
MALELRNIHYTYNPGTTFERHALKGISMTIGDGEFVGLIGHTGSGKSTLIQHLNGLLRAYEGDILYNGSSIYAKGYDMKQHRFNVGMVFQYPEHQLFETTVLKDVCFGPLNMGLSKEEAEERAKAALRLVELPDEYWLKSPFILSGGQKRRAAIAGVIAMEPRILVMDEPAAGLDPAGREGILKSVEKIHHEKGVSVLLVSHNMDDVAAYADKVVVLNKGEVFMTGTPAEVFSRTGELEAVGLSSPGITHILNDLKEKGFPVDTRELNADKAADIIAACFNKE